MRRVLMFFSHLKTEYPNKRTARSIGAAPNPACLVSVQDLFLLLKPIGARTARSRLISMRMRPMLKSSPHRTRPRIELAIVIVFTSSLSPNVRTDKKENTPGWGCLLFWPNNCARPLHHLNHASPLGPNKAENDELNNKEVRAIGILGHISSMYSAGRGRRLLGPTLAHDSNLSTPNLKSGGPNPAAGEFYIGL